jgi:hypothetical protein
MTRKHKKKQTFSGVLYLNKNFMPFQVVSKVHAIKAVASGRAVAINPQSLRTIEDAGKDPVVLRSLQLVLFDREIQTGPRRLKTKNLYESVLERDNYTCVYCGKEGLTIDHVVPRAQGGLTTSKNCVTACKSCNSKKADRTPEEAGMPFLYKPKTINELLFDRFKEIMEQSSFEEKPLSE